MAKSGKFLFLFKRAGNVVLVNPVGDLIIRPSECSPPQLLWAAVCLASALATKVLRGAALRFWTRALLMLPSCVVGACWVDGTAQPLPALGPCPSPIPLPLLFPSAAFALLPGFLERNVQRTLTHSVKQHLLVSYHRSFAAVLRGQHTGKGLR